MQQTIKSIVALFMAAFVSINAFETMKKLTLYVVLILATVCVYGQHKQKFSEESHNGQVFSIEISEYNAANKFGEDTKTNLVSKSVAYFDMTGNLIKEIRCHNSEHRHLDTVFIYNNEMGRVSSVLQLEAKEKWLETGIKSIKYYGYDTVMQEIYSYNANGKIADISTYKKKYSDKMELVSEVKYEYAANLYTEKKYNSNSDLEETSSYTNNGKKKVTKERFGTVTYIYDNNYKLVSESVQTDISDMKDNSRYIYNQQGDVITKKNTFTSRNKNGGHTDNWVYFYDDNKNWTVCKYYSDNNNAKEKRIETWTEREITYAKDFEQWQRLVDSIQTEDLSAVSYHQAKMKADSIKMEDSLLKAEKLLKEEQRQKELNRKSEEIKQKEEKRQQEEEEKLLSIARGDTKKVQIKKCYNNGDAITFPYQTTSGDYYMNFDKKDVIKHTKDDAEYYLANDRSVFVCKIKDGKKYRYRIVYNGRLKYSIEKGDTWDLSEKCYKNFEEYLKL